MSDRFEDYLREHLRRESSAIARVPEPLTARIRSSLRSEQRRPLTQFASVGALLVVAAIAAVAVVQWQSVQPSPKSGPGAVSPAPKGLSCSTGSSGGTSGPPMRLKEIRGSQNRIEFEFEPMSDFGVPTYQLSPQDSAAFLKRPGNSPVTLQGSAGLRVIFPDMLITEPYRIRVSWESSSQSLIREIKVVDGSGAGLVVGVGLSARPCFMIVHELPYPPTLVLNLGAESDLRTTR